MRPDSDLGLPLRAHLLPLTRPAHPEAALYLHQITNPTSTHTCGPPARPSPPSQDADLLHIAEAALTAPLPPGWTVHLDPGGAEFFHDAAAGASQYEHPCDKGYRREYLREREARRRREGGAAAGAGGGGGGGGDNSGGG